jgi:opacity protein-like surface antigen
MKKFFFVALVLLLVGAVTTSFSQAKLSFGPKLGIVMANASFDPDVPAGVTKSSRTGFTGGAALEVMFSGIPLGIEADLLYTMGGTKLEASSGGVTGTQTEKLTFIEIPVLLKGKFATKSPVSPYVYAGPSLAFTASAKEVVEVTGYGSQETDVKDQIKSTNFSLVFGGGAEFQIESKVGLTFDVRYGLGLSDMAKDPDPGDPKIKTNGLSLMVGCLFTL